MLQSFVYHIFFVVDSYRNISKQIYLFSNLFHRVIYQIDTILMLTTNVVRVRTESRKEGLYTLTTLLLQSLRLGGPLHDCRSYESKTIYRTIRDDNLFKVLLTKMNLDLIITRQRERIKDADHPMDQIRNGRRPVHLKSYRCPLC